MTLKNYLLLFTAGTLLSAPAMARNPHQTKLPKPPGMSDRVYQLVSAKLQSYEQAVRNAGNTAAKTTASAQRVIGGAYYEWGSASPMLVDSAIIKYSGQRSSRFSDYSLQFNFSNPTDQPGDVEAQDSYVHYDSLDIISYTTGTNVRSWRAYNPGDQVIRLEDLQGDQKVYSYLSNSRLSKVITMSDLGSGRDTAQREFYVYNANGLQFRDSIEIFDSSAMSWTHAATYEFGTSATGRINTIALSVNFAGSLIPFLYQSYTYAPNGKVSKIMVDQVDFNSFSLMPYSKDSIGYTGNSMVYEDYFVMDQAMGTYELAYTDRRRLNAQGLADSVSQISLGGGDDGSIAIMYDANNYPTRLTYTERGGITPAYETRYYYQLAPISVPKVNAVKPVTLAPNPATNIVRLDNKLGARFRILDLNGRLMMDGTIGAAGSIGVDGLTPGMYSILLSDNAGDQFSGRFVKH